VTGREQAIQARLQLQKDALAWVSQFTPDQRVGVACCLVASIFSSTNGVLVNVSFAAGLATELLNAAGRVADHSQCPEFLDWLQRKVDEVL
jgi:hypothetical protein